MTPIPPIAPTSGVMQTVSPSNATHSSTSFAQMLENGLDKINQNMLSADAKVRAFILDDSIPVHQVTFALDQARASLELALQVRTRLLEGYQQFMNMQL